MVDETDLGYELHGSRDWIWCTRERRRVVGSKERERRRQTVKGSGDPSAWKTRDFENSESCTRLGLKGEKREADISDSRSRCMT